MTDSLQLTVQPDLDLLPRATACERIVEISIQAPDAPTTSRRPRLNLALVLDRSGSMSGAKLEYVKQAARFVLERLKDDDRAAVVVYDDEINVLTHGARLSPDVRSQALSQVDRIHSGGSTNLFDGWLTGCREVAEGQGPEQINRALLLTDGLANVGITELDSILPHVRELSARGVSTSTFGVGHGFNEHLLEAMANQGQGNFYYIESPAQIPDLFLSEFNELAAVTARDVTLKVEVPLGASISVPGDWQVRENEGCLQISVGHLYSGRRQELYLKLLLPPSQGADTLDLRVEVTATGLNDRPLADRFACVFRYADAQAVQAARPKEDVRQRYSRVDMAHIANEALKLERAGQREQASRLVNQNLVAAAPYLSEEDRAKYDVLSENLKQGMPEPSRKAAQWDSYNTKRGRNR